MKLIYRCAENAKDRDGNLCGSLYKGSRISRYYCPSKLPPLTRNLLLDSFVFRGASNFVGI